MAEVFRVDSHMLETGRIHFRNPPVYVKVPATYWPHETCMCCGKTLGANLYLGYALASIAKTRSIHLLGSGFFCDRCELVSRALTSVLQEWGLVSSNAEDWEVALRQNGSVISHQMHVSVGSTPIPNRQASFYSTFGSRLYRYIRERIMDTRLAEQSDKPRDDEIIDLTDE